jgi:Cd2+/Zn2+-exporting ATPase
MLQTVNSVEPAEGFTEDSLLELAANAEVLSNHPIALSVMKEYANGRTSGKLERDNLSKYTKISGYGVSVNLDGRTILAGNQELMQKTDVIFEESQTVGTKVYISTDGIFAGCIIIK